MFSLYAVGTLFGSAYLVYQYIIFPLFLSPLSKIPPAHWSVPSSARWINSHRLNGKTGLSATLSAHNRLGPIVRLSPDEISVASIDGLRKIYSGGFEKDESYVQEFTNYGTVNLVSMLGNREHGMQKRMISHVYSKSYIQNSGDGKRAWEILVGRLLEVLYKAEGAAFDAYGLNQGIGADFMSAYLFGLENATDFMRDTETRTRISQCYRKKFKRLPGEAGATETVESFVLDLCRAAARTTERDIDSETGTSPVVYAQLSSQMSKRFSTPSPENKELLVASEMFDQFTASIETSRISLTYMEWELSRRPSLQQSLRQELLTLSPPIQVGESQLPDPKSIDSLPLLNAILKETLRLYTPSPATLTRITPPVGTTIEGYFIPGNIVIGTSGGCMHQNSSVFPEPQEFKPERWLTEDEEKRKEMNRWFWAFGSGGRMCIGSHYAIHMLKLSIAAIYSNFETEIVDDEGIEQEDAFLAGPVGEKLVLRFRALASRSDQEQT
ncbi:putative cytochrome P450 monooxygenase [Mollisia scopiformis]|uniref:Putative cytochrome P450 monooxygenase n=1 Tax=Mollisia scopiformis TaxID=149040 RepID=A0A194X0P4_MOLSC|nr:putative cytochrome P450 monooxygenase [Mollisia scopiformis]KUJ13771.1 putative cytochrome P450 monooxygenase [Mollisia scopiformis]